MKNFFETFITLQLPVVNQPHVILKVQTSVHTHRTQPLINLIGGEPQGQQGHVEQDLQMIIHMGHEMVWIYIAKVKICGVITGIDTNYQLKFLLYGLPFYF